MDSSAVSARLIGTIFVEKGLITEEQLELALEQQRTTGDRIGEILVEQFGIERLDLASALAEQWAEYERQGNAEERERQGDSPAAAPAAEGKIEGAVPPMPAGAKRPIGEIFVERGLVTDNQLDEALEQQRETGGRLGEILVASGKLSRLELASALADQWASFQKLRPPTEVPAAPAVSPPNGDVMPTPEVGAPLPLAAPAPELVSMVDTLSARVDQVAAEKGEWRPELEKTAEHLRTRLDQLEQSVAQQSSPGEPARDEALRSEVADLAARIAAIPAPSDEWRDELAQVAENLRTRLERVEGRDPSDQVAELRGTLDELSAKVDAMPAPPEDWHEAVAGLAERVEAIPTPSDEWRGAVEELRGAVGELRSALGEIEVRHDAESDLRGRFDALAARVASLSGASSADWDEEIAAVRRDLEETRRDAGERGEELRATVAELASRIDAAPAPSEDWREPLATLSSRIDSLPVPSDEWRGAVDGLAARIESLPLDGWRSELAGVAENLRVRIEELERRPVGSDDVEGLRGALRSLAERVDALPVPSDEWRGAVDGLAARIESLPLDGWRSELAEVAENLRTRVERVEHGLERASGTAAIDELRATVDTFAARFDALPVPSDEWRELFEELTARVDQLSERDIRADLAEATDALRKRIENVEQTLPGQARAAAVTEIAEQVNELGRRFEGLDAVERRVHELATQLDALPSPSEEWRQPLAELTARVDELATDEWKPELAQVAEGLRTKIDRVARDAERGQSERIESLAGQIAGLAVRVEHLPAAANEVRAELAQQVEIFAGRMTQLEQRVSGLAGGEALQGLVLRVDDLTEHVATLPGAADEVRAELARQVEIFAGRMTQLEQKVSALPAGDALDELRTRIDELSHRAADTSAVDELGRHIDELAHRRSADALDAELQPRFAEIDAAMHELRTATASLPESVDSRLAAFSAQIGSLRNELRSHLEKELEGVRGSVHTLAETTSRRIGEVAESVDSAIAGLDERFPSHGVVHDLRARLEEHGERVDGLGSELTAFERHSEEKAAGRTAELGALGARLEAVESSLQGATGWTDAIEGTIERIDGLELRLLETAAAEADERNAEVARVRGELSARVEGLEGAQVTSRDLRDLRDIVEVVERRVDDRASHDEAARKALEDSVRSGLKGLGKKLTASGEAYLETSRELTRSLSGLELALTAAATGADEAPRATNRPAGTSVFLAFAPTAEGYRLLECEGMPPELEGRMTVDGCEGELVVTRIGTSPLPFDTRPCVYLEQR